MQCKTVLPHCGHSQLRHMTLRCSLLHHKSPSSWRHTDATLYTVHGQTYMTFVGILASIRWVPRNAFFFAVPKTSNTCLSLRPNFSGDSGSSSPATAVPEISHLTASKQGAMFHAQNLLQRLSYDQERNLETPILKKKHKILNSASLMLHQWLVTPGSSHSPYNPHSHGPPASGRHFCSRFWSASFGPFFITGPRILRSSWTKAARESFISTSPVHIFQ